MEPSCEIGMPSAAANCGPIGITITKSRMLTNCTAGTSSPMVGSGWPLAMQGPPSAVPGPFTRRSCLTRKREPRDERHVVGLAAEGAAGVAVGRGALQVDEPHAAAGEDMVEMHAQPQEARGGEAARRTLVDLPQRRLRRGEARLLAQEAIHRRGGRRVEVARHDERLAAPK